MGDLLKAVLAAPIANLFILAGLVFLGIAVVGNISGKIQPGRAGRIASGVLGVILVLAGLAIHLRPIPPPAPADGPRPSVPPPPTATPAAPREAPGQPPPSPTAPPKPPPAALRVREASLGADPSSYEGPCPVRVVFTGRISVGGSGGTVSFKFLRSDGASEPTHTLIFDAPGSRNVRTVWTLGDLTSSRAFSGWQSIQIVEPQELRSAPAHFRVQCRPQAQVTPTPTLEPAPAGFRVVEVLLRADPFNYVGPCPVTIRFSGRISVVGGSGRVSYKFLRSDGASAPIQTLTFDAPGSKEASTSWTLGGPALPTFAGWQAMQIFEPQGLTSNRASFKIQCR